MEYNVIDDQIPLVTYAATKDTVWNLYIGGSIQVRELNSGTIEYRMADDTEWTFAGLKGVYA